MIQNLHPGPDRHQKFSRPNYYTKFQWNRPITFAEILNPESETEWTNDRKTDLNLITEPPSSQDRGKYITCKNVTGSRLKIDLENANDWHQLGTSMTRGGGLVTSDAI